MIYRRDIDGLRAIAVLSVVAYHAFPTYVAGGFIGVDVFFVISGYLISSILIEKFDGAGGVIEFYAHRIKRIFPALFLVLFFCITFGWFSLLSEEYLELGHHVTGAVEFISNYILYSESGYFDNLAEKKPLLHLWSLAIEAQFYMVWPLILWIFWSVKYGVPLIMLMAMVGSYCLNIREISFDQSAAFYLPQTRVFEFICGGFLGWAKIKIDINKYLFTRKGEINKIPGEIASVLGFSILFFGFFAIDKTFKYPGHWALIPVISTLLIIFAGKQSWLNSILLGNGVSVYIGLISYSLYLWHWPLLAFYRIVNGESPAAVAAFIIVLVSFLLAILTFHYVERPVRYYKNLVALPLLVGAMLIVGMCGYLITIKNGFPNRMEAHELSKDQLSPPKMLENIANCKSIFPKYSGDCVASHSNINFSGTFENVFFGDSHARALSMDLIINPKNSHTLMLGKNGCPPLSGVDRFNFGYSYGCEKYYNEVINIFKNLDLSNSTLIYTMYFSAYYNGSGVSPDGIKYISNGGVHIQPTGEWKVGSNAQFAKTFENSFDQTLRDLSPLFKRIVVVLQPPELLVSADKCYMRPFRRFIDDCLVPKDFVLARQAGYRKDVYGLVNNYRNITVYDPMQEFCDEKFCYASPASQMLYRDDNHISMLGSRNITQTIVAIINSKK